ncbi:MAG: 2-amino-4-hydroxy-6-hydroxymethyldihydropteridine diphosphokinase [Gammaproteobacteria bacterium]|nr:2-amino-4-hydroxy-6-hydroxymethyldihydropteridine diphosphokinase [Gammaproteobacteria bacterium]
MARVFVAIGSNVDRAVSVRAGVRALRQAFGDLTISPVYESRAVGFEGDDFYNLVVAFDTDHGPREVAGMLDEIEQRFARERSAPRFAPRALDLDLLLYNNLVAHDRDLDLPREDIGMYAFVLRPLAEIAGERRHPVTGQRFAELWAGFDRNSQYLLPVKLDFDGNENMNSAES